MRAQNKKHSQFTLETVITPLKDEQATRNIGNSPIWDRNILRLKPEEVENRNIENWYSYLIKFDGLKPIHCVKMKKL